MTDKERDEQFEVVFSGGDELIADRLTKPSPLWSNPKPTTRVYNKTGNHTENPDFWDRYDSRDPCIFTNKYGEGFCNRGTRGCPKTHVKEDEDAIDP